MGAPVGNRNAVGCPSAEKPFRDAVSRAIAQDDSLRLRKAAEKLLDLAAQGESWAVKELADRMDGKPAQQTVITGANNGPLQIEEFRRTVVDPKYTDT